MAILFTPSTTSSTMGSSRGHVLPPDRHIFEKSTPALTPLAILGLNPHGIFLYH